jgi:cobyrinic acid a,c-diamide synthase
MVSGTESGVGKTTVALAIMAALRQQGLEVQPLKCGPDFLDTGHHTRMCGRAARNVDTWMLSDEENRLVLQDSASGADVVVAEGMMGLFDGSDGKSDIGSSAQIARLLRLPVVLVVDASKSARSLAAVLLGFESFDRNLPLAGVILNRVAGEFHYQMLRDAIESSCETDILGWLPLEPSIIIPERHLGLHTASEQSADSQAAMRQSLAMIANRQLDLDKLLRLKCGLELKEFTSRRAASNPQDKIRIGVPSDAAFSFYYEDNLDLLRERGAEIVRFSPLSDSSLPPDLDSLYFGGGYPELHAEQLSSKHEMRQQVRAFAASGKPVYAECGGLVYLSENLNVGDRNFAMAGVLPLSIAMTDRLVQFGYSTVTLVDNCLLGCKGTTIRGHSFHYSRIRSQDSIDKSYHVHYSPSGDEEFEGFRQENVLASYIHLHFRSNPAVADNFVVMIQQARSLQAVQS